MFLRDTLCIGDYRHPMINTCHTEFLFEPEFLIRTEINEMTKMS